jgi:hypothetical protein
MSRRLASAPPTNLASGERPGLSALPQTIHQAGSSMPFIFSTLLRGFASRFNFAQLQASLSAVAN